uniref:Pseudouridine synthase 7 like n=1 Tax=Salvator merianae TaxID=96440 RepID=A0A8D0CAQ0_SALMN
MEEEPGRPLLCYPSVYLNDHVGFCGSIKTFPSDFIVKEINTLGQLVNEIAIDSLHQSNESLLEQTKLCPQDSKRLRLSLPEESVNQEYCSMEDSIVCCTSEYLPSVTKESEDCKRNNGLECHIDKISTLDTLLENPLREQLSQFACHVKETWNSKSEPASLRTEFSLGPFPDKKIRACLHSLIRQEYPFLITVTKCGEVIVKANQDYQELCQLVSEEEACGFLKFLDAKLDHSNFAFKPDGNKEHRKTVHHFISKKFGKLLETKSFSDPQQKVVIVVRFRKKSACKKKMNSDSREKEEIYTAFTLRKENLETLEAISYLSSELGVLPSDFSYAGIKDKRAITYQAMVVRKVTPKRLKEVGNTTEKKGISVFNVYSTSQPLKLGQLQGNHFDIIVRDLTSQSNDSSASLKERISEATESVKVQAVKLFFTPEDSDDPVNKAKKYFLQTEDAKGTLAMLPDFKVREKMLLRALNRYGINHEGCTRGWLSIPHSMRIFYVHAYCSKIWNEAASYRFKTYGTRVVAGDLIFSEKCIESWSLNDKVHIVTPEEAAANQYGINQVILPMTGYSVQYPSNKVGEWYHERLAHDGLQVNQFRLPALQLNVPGCYRYLLKYPHDLLYSFLKCDEIERESEDILQKDSKTSLSMSFWLDPSSYATVCLGEIMKCDLLNV